MDQKKHLVEEQNYRRMISSNDENWVNLSERKRGMIAMITKTVEMAQFDRANSIKQSIN